jgi:uncharacterized protein DUF6644
MPLFETIQNQPFFAALRESALVYPIVLATHLSGIAVFGGAILMTDLRLFGWAMADQPGQDVMAGLRTWKWVGLAVMAVSGVLLAGAKAVMCGGNPYFQLKIGLLALVGLHALVFRRRALSMPRIAKVSAALSLALWLAILSAGRLIAYYEPPR